MSIVFFRFFNPPFLPQLFGLVLNLLWENIWIMLVLVALWDHTSPQWRDDCIINPFSPMAQRDPSTKVPVLSPIPAPTPGDTRAWATVAILPWKEATCPSGTAVQKDMHRVSLGRTTEKNKTAQTVQCARTWESTTAWKGRTWGVTGKSNKNHTIKESSWNNSSWILSGKGEQKSLFNS